MTSIGKTMVFFSNRKLQFEVKLIFILVFFVFIYLYKFCYCDVIYFFCDVVYGYFTAASNVYNIIRYDFIHGYHKCDEVNLLSIHHLRISHFELTLYVPEL